MKGFEGGSRFAGAKRFALRGWIKIILKAKDDVDNVGAGRAAKGANPFIRTRKSTNFDKKFVDFPYLYKLLMLTKKVGSGLFTKKKCML